VGDEAAVLIQAGACVALAEFVEVPDQHRIVGIVGDRRSLQRAAHLAAATDTAWIEADDIEMFAQPRGDWQAHDSQYEVDARYARTTRVADDHTDALRRVGGPRADDRNSHRVAERLAIVNGDRQRATVERGVVPTRREGDRARVSLP
jgi:hypothetical protein